MISPLLGVTFAAVGVSGIMMFLHIRVGSIKLMHEWLGIAMVVVAVLHLMLNWRVFINLYRYRLAIMATLAGTALLGATLLVGANDKGGPGGRRGGPPCADPARPAAK
jgi:hypothetical protein